MLRAVVDRWWVILVRGIAAMLLGLGMVLWPGVTLWAVILFFGAFTMADGITAIALGVHGKPGGRVWWEMVALGMLALFAGIGAVLWPQITLLIFIYYAGASAIIHGVIEIIAAIKLRKHIAGEWLLGLSGACSILFGILLFSCPITAAKALAIFIGVYMMLFGAMAVALAFRVRSLKSHVSASA
jgi:uncharacterized membrane protein HdeD (DUF308 family)